MPYDSLAQSRLFHAKHKKLAKKYDEEMTPEMWKNLPDYVHTPEEEKKMHKHAMHSALHKIMRGGHKK